MHVRKPSFFQHQRASAQVQTRVDQDANRVHQPMYKQACNRLAQDKISHLLHLFLPNPLLWGNSHVVSFGSYCDPPTYSLFYRQTYYGLQ